MRIVDVAEQIIELIIIDELFTLAEVFIDYTKFTANTAPVFFFFWFPLS